MTTEYKASRYNIFVPDGDELILFNSASGVMASIQGQDRETVAEILWAPNDLEPDADKAKLQKQMIAAGFLVPLIKDELKVIEAASWARRRDMERGFAITIAPGIQCNLRCPYCFQNHENKAMSLKVQDAVVAYTARYASRVPRLTVDWYGGEPLLYLKIIQSLTARLREVCRSSGTKYFATITTNGILLSRGVAEQLRGLGVVRAQITLDGPAEIHDVRRPFTNGQGTYKIILDNIVGCQDLMYVRVRVNLDKTNFRHVPQLMDDLVERGIHGRVELDLKQVVSSQLRPWDDKTLTTREYAQTIASLYGLALERGFHIPAQLLEPSASYCGADNDAEIMVDPEGYLYKCTDVYGPNDAVGHLQANGTAEFLLPKLQLWGGKDPFGDADCMSCEVLPVCMGGCNLKRLNGKGDWCDNLKFNVRSFIKLVYKSKKTGHMADVASINLTPL